MIRTITSKSILSSQISRCFAIKQFKLPDLGEKIKEAVIKKWTVKEGDLVDEFDTIAEVATDKLFTEIPSPYKGRIHKLFYKEEDACNVGDVLLEIDTPDIEDKQSEIAVDAPRVDTHVSQEDLNNIKNIEESTKVLASPAVRGLAKQLGIKLEDVKTIYHGDKITKEDLQTYVEGLNKKQKIEENKKVLETNNFKERTDGHVNKFKKHEDKDKDDHNHKADKHKHKDDHHNKADKSKTQPIDRKINNIQNEQTAVKMKLFEQGMVKSMNHAVTVPHFNLHDEYDITELEVLRQSLKAQGQSFTLFSFIVKAFSLAIESMPRMNSSYYPENNQYECQLNSVHNISIAIDSPQGLAAPNLKNVGSLSISDINNQIKELQKITSEGKLTAYNLEGGTIALSNIGTITGSFAAPLTLPNQVCIVALGKLSTKPVFNNMNSSFEPKKILPISFGCDHRVLDGATVARFSVAWKKLLENPGLMLIQLR